MTGIRTTILLTFMAAVLAAAAPTTALAPALPPGKVLLGAEPERFAAMGAALDNAKAAPVDVPDRPGGHSRGWRVDVRERPKEPWGIQLAADVTGDPPRRGDVVLLTAWVRATRTADETNAGTIGLVLEQSGEPFAKTLSAQFSVGRAWQRLDVPATVQQDYAKSRPRVSLRLGFAPQTIEIAGVELRNFGPDVPIDRLPRTAISYAGREPNAPWRKAAAERIEQHRKAPLTVRVVDAAGKPVAGATVAVRMTRHAFPFGCVYNPSRVTGSTAGEPDSQTYRDTFVEHFNVGVDEWATKWPAWEVSGSRQTALRSLAWMRKHGVRVRGHVMVWPSWSRTPEAVKALANDPPALRRRVAQHIRSVGSALAGQVEEWDVVNEPYAHNDLLKILGDDAMAEWFAIARQADPHARLYLNETGVPTSTPSDSRYDVLFNQVKRLKELGAPIGGIGMQAHFGGNLNPPADLLAIYDRFATLELPVRITELDVDVTDEQLQADYLRDFMTASFSHPGVNGIVMWGFWEGQHWRPAAALWRKDWTLKPAGRAWLDLVRRQWWTTAQGSTAADGAFATRGFLGDYEIAVPSADGQTRTTTSTLAAEGRDVTVTLP